MTSRLVALRAGVVAVLLLSATVALLVGGGAQRRPLLSRPPSARSDERGAGSGDQGDAPRVRVPRPSSPRRIGGSVSPQTAVIRFANAYINWNYADVAVRLSALARISVGQARSAMQLAAAQVSADSTLRGSGIANQGSVEAVGAIAGHPDQWAVVTLEQTSASRSSAYQGLAPAWHVTVATVQRQPGGSWVVSGWQPES
jgi:hypothetical protein